MVTNSGQKPLRCYACSCGMVFGFTRGYGYIFRVLQKQLVFDHREWKGEHYAIEWIVKKI